MREPRQDVSVDDGLHVGVDNAHTRAAAVEAREGGRGRHRKGVVVTLLGYFNLYTTHIQHILNLLSLLLFKSVTLKV